MISCKSIAILPIILIPTEHTRTLPMLHPRTGNYNRFMSNHLNAAKYHQWSHIGIFVKIKLLQCNWILPFTKPSLIGLEIFSSGANIGGKNLTFKSSLRVEPLLSTTTYHGHDQVDRNNKKWNRPQLFQISGCEEAWSEDQESLQVKARLEFTLRALVIVWAADDSFVA